MSTELQKKIARITETWADLAHDQVSSLVSNFRSRIVKEIATRQKKKISDCVVLPKNTKFIREDDHAVVLVVEEPPQIRTIAVNNYDDNKPSYYNLAFPYCIFILKWTKNYYSGITFDSLRFAVRNLPLKTTQDTLLHSGMPNLGYQDHMGLKVCLGVVGHVFKPEDELAVQVEKIITHFWLSNWDTINRTPIHVTKWVELTKKNPNKILAVRWKPGRTLEKVIKLLVTTNNPEIAMTKELIGLYEKAWGRINMSSSKIKKLIGQLVKEELAKK